MATASTLRKDIAAMEASLSDPGIPADIKQMVSQSLEQAKKQLEAAEAKSGAPKTAKKPRERKTEKKAAAPKPEPKPEPKAEKKPRKRKTAKKAAPKKAAAKKPRVRKTAKKTTTRGLSDRAKNRIAAAKKRRKEQGLAYSMKSILKDAARIAPRPGREKRDNRVDYATGSYPYLEKGGEMAKGGLFGGSRIKSALNRDRAYKSEEPWEKKYVRKTKPKNPRYNRYGEGGETHRNG